MSTTRSTHDVEVSSPFEKHGEIHYQVEGRILRTVARGPFNNELVQAIPEAISQLVRQLSLQGKWGQIITFQDNALGSPSALAEFAQYLKARYTNPETNPVTAMVFGHHVEGAIVMAPLYQKCYLDAGIECRIFEDYATALYWMETKIRQTSDLIAWNDKYRIGDAAIDEQHEEIFLRAADVIAASTRDGQAMCAMRLYQYAVTHFSHEEELMFRLRYPEIEDHLRQHEQLLTRLREIMRTIAKDCMVKADLESFISRWLLDHIAHVDARLAAYVKA